MQVIPFSVSFAKIEILLNFKEYISSLLLRLGNVYTSNDLRMNSFFSPFAARTFPIVAAEKNSISYFD